MRLRRSKKLDTHVLRSETREYMTMRHRYYQQLASRHDRVLKVDKRSADDYDLSDTRRSGRTVKFDDDVLKSLVESDPRLSVQEL
ncbi:hypothetical protein E2986_12790 [Frieseomelitta varia]|uniref:Uncharacterized protein n=1 Tax=Frieseomelitta varia TaxID=561572 RepID=A0A833R7V2_9HYME|nr:hypothetical protein E2986_12790 [Frieseomelitta varia]